MCSTIMYNVTQRSSAVKSRWRALVTFVERLATITKKKIKYRFKSPINIYYINKKINDEL